LGDVFRGRVLRVQISIAHREQEICDGLRPHLGFQPLRFCRAEVQGLKKSVGSNRVRQVVVKISQADGDSVFPEFLSDPDVPAQISFGLQPKIISENFVLTAWWTESRCHTGMQCCICPVDLVAAGDTISPYATELIEVIEPSAGDKN